jgi:hypothetical protein
MANVPWNPADGLHRLVLRNAREIKWLDANLARGCRGRIQPFSFFNRAVSRETFREPVFLWITPLEAPRIIWGSAAFNAEAAASRFPDARASSTLRTAVRIWLFRFLLMAVRFAVLRTRFSAEAWLGMRYSA